MLPPESGPPPPLGGTGEEVLLRATGRGRAGLVADEDDTPEETELSIDLCGSSTVKEDVVATDGLASCAVSHGRCTEALGTPVSDQNRAG